MRSAGFARGLDKCRRDSGDRKGQAGHDHKRGGERTGGPEPSDLASILRIRAETVGELGERVPQPLPDRLEVPGHRHQNGEQARQVPGAPGSPAGRHHGRRRPRGDLPADPLQAVTSRLDRVGREPQRPPERVLEHGLARIGTTMAHASRSSTERSADIARDVWLLTAPLVMPIAAAIWASDRSP
jgi:hypothetical protein